METVKSSIVSRFEEFGKELCGDQHGWKKRFAEKLGILPTQITSILAGNDALGAKMQQRLRDLGADVDYIMTGRAKPADSGRVHIQFDMPGHLTAEQGEKYKKLIEEIGKVSSDDPEAIEKMLILTQTIFKKNQ